MVKSLKTVDSMKVYIALFSTVFVVAVALNGVFIDKNVKLARVEARNLGNQIIAGGLKNLPNSKLKSSRAIASLSGREKVASVMTRWGVMRLEGTIGKDPWGEKFNYKILPDMKEKKVVFLVWSNGPNRKKDTMESDSFKNRLIRGGKLSLIGDDVGTSQVIPL